MFTKLLEPYQKITSAPSKKSRNKKTIKILRYATINNLRKREREKKCRHQSVKKQKGVKGKLK